AVDLDGRALEFTKINAALNRLPIDGDEGDLLAPVEGQRFDLVVSQPPFVIRPPGIGQTTFLHGGPRGEELALRLFAGLPSVLRPGGAALVRFDAPAADTPVLRRVLTALATDRSEESVRDLRVALLSARGASADLQAIGYAAAQHPALDAAYREDVFRYRDHLAKMNIERTLHCFLRLEVPADSGGYAVSRAVPTLGAYGHEAVVEWVSALELASLPPNRLEAAPIAPAPDLQLSDERSLRPSVPKSSTGESPQPEGGRLLVRRPGNLIDAQELSDAGAVLLEALHQSGTLGGAIAQFAERVGAAPDEVRGDLQGFVRQLLVAGVLVAGNSNSDPNGA
ncbi:MAG: PqqD family peptide modification chaperone, partial [Myxococcota bacterium]